MIGMWLYVSQVATTGDAARILEDIARQSGVRNAALGVTSGLVFTGHRFAQWMEGPEAMLRAVKQSIGTDERHRDLTTLREEVILHRFFVEPMATTLNQSQYVDGLLDRALAGGPQSRRASVDALSTLIMEFARSR